MLLWRDISFASESWHCQLRMYVVKSFSRKDRRGSGLAFLVKKSLEKQLVVMLSFSTFEAFEARVVHNSVSLTLVSLYWLPHSRQQDFKKKGRSFKVLHWLTVKERIIFTIATFVFPFFDGALPPYLSSCLSIHSFSHSPFQFRWKRILEQGGK